MSRDLQFLAVALGARAQADAAPDRPPQLQVEPAPDDRGGAAARAAVAMVNQAHKRRLQRLVVVREG